MKFFFGVLIVLVLIFLAVLFGISHFGKLVSTVPDSSYRASPTIFGLEPTPNPYFGKWSLLSTGALIQHFAYRFQDREYSIQVIKIDPQQMRLSLEYDPAGKFISEWKKDDAIVMNAGFFKEKNAAVGLLYINGVRQDQHRINQSGTGLLIIDESSVRIRDLQAQPIVESDSFYSALQSFPLLISESQIQVSGRSVDQDRRTAVGVDEQGSLYLITSPSPYLSLYEFAVQLQKTGIAFTHLLNLDGGGSTGIAISMDGTNLLTNSQTPVPTVLLIQKK